MELWRPGPPPPLPCWVPFQLLGTSLGRAPRTWEDREQWGAPCSFPTNQWGGGRELAENGLILYADRHMSCLCPKPGWLVMGMWELGVHSMGEGREQGSGGGRKGASRHINPLSHALTWHF